MIVLKKQKWCCLWGHRQRGDTDNGVETQTTGHHFTPIVSKADIGNENSVP
jgi:hypothetical protein